MTEQDIATRLSVLETKLDQIYASTEKTRTYFLWTIIISVVVFVLPLVVLMFAAPAFISSYSAQLESLDINSISNY